MLVFPINCLEFTHCISFSPLPESQMRKFDRYMSRRQVPMWQKHWYRLQSRLTISDVFSRQVRMHQN